MKTLTILFLAHLLADFVLQPDSLVRLKSDRTSKLSLWNKGVFIHSCIQMISSIVLLAIIGELRPVLLLPVFLISVFHYLIDDSKPNGKDKAAWVLIFDQFAHVFIIYGVLWVFKLVLPLPDIGTYLVSLGSHQIPLSLASKIILGSIAVVCLVWVSGQLIKAIMGQLRLRPFGQTSDSSNKDKPSLSTEAASFSEKTGGTNTPRQTPGLSTPESKQDETNAVSIGLYIGYLERLLIVFFMISGIYTGLGLLGTLKTIARFKQLENRENAEYFILGTLLSMLMGIFFGALLTWVIKY
ncbi:MAG: DUF3307 domain-containing protein [Anaerolineaceae bacterium]